jgi:hypothetical protein
MFVYNKWLWSGTGTLFTTTNWAINEPSNTNTTLQACAMLKEQLFDQQCQDSYKIACEQRC